MHWHPYIWRYLNAFPCISKSKCHLFFMLYSYIIHNAGLYDLRGTLHQSYRNRCLFQPLSKSSIKLWLNWTKGMNKVTAASKEAKIVQTESMCCFFYVSRDVGLKAWPCSLFNGRWCGWTPDKCLSLGLPDSSSTLLKQTKEQQNLVYFNCGVKNKPEETNCHGAMKVVLAFVTGFNCGDQSTIVSAGKRYITQAFYDMRSPWEVI